MPSQQPASQPASLVKVQAKPHTRRVSRLQRRLGSSGEPATAPNNVHGIIVSTLWLPP